MSGEVSSDSGSLVNEFCSSDEYSGLGSVTAGGDLSPCFVEIVILGSLHIIFMIFCVIRIYQLYTPKLTHVVLRKRGVMKLRIVCGLVAFLCPLLQLSGQLGNSTGDGGTSSYTGGGSRDSVAPFQIVSLALQSLAWLIDTGVMVKEHSVLARHGQWIGRFLHLSALFAHIVKLRLVVEVYDEEGATKDFFFFLYTVGSAGALVVLSCVLCSLCTQISRSICKFTHYRFNSPLSLCSRSFRSSSGRRRVQTITSSCRRGQAAQKVGNCELV
jgi:hypothetical protein